MNRDVLEINDIISQKEAKTKDYTFFSASHGTFSIIDHMLRHKTSTDTRKLKQLSAFYLITMYYSWILIKETTKNERKVYKKLKTEQLINE